MGVSHESILECHAAGMHPAEIARNVGLRSPSWVAEILRRHGFEPHSGVVETGTAVLERMADMYRSGLTLAQIGEEYGITRERVRRQLQKQGISGADGGASKRQPRVTARYVKRDARSFARYGLSFEEMNHWRASGLLRAFTVHKRGAKARGIEFLMTFAQWIGVWVASGRLEQRGARRGAYVMARHRDVGPYSVENVRIVLWEENMAEGVVTARLGAGRGWTLVDGRYQVTARSRYVGSFKTQKEAEEAYLNACTAHREAFYAN